MKKGVVSLVALVCLVIPSIAFSQEQSLGIEAYITDLHAQGKERVGVVFKEGTAVDTALVEKYGGKIIRLLPIINGLVCELPQENIEPLKEEPAVQDVFPDMLMQINSGSEQRDPEEIELFNCFKEDYFNRIKEEYHAALEAARQEYLTYVREYLSKKQKLILAYVQLLNQYRRTGRINSPAYRILFFKYVDLLKEYYAGLKEALALYHEKITAAKGAYGTAQSEWEVKVDEMMALAYTGPVTVRWNNLEEGLNSKAAWDNYSLDGTGIKIAFMDSGINYMLENLGGGIGPGFKCLGGKDYVGDDDDPMPLLDGSERHGTQVASLAVGAGINKVVGVAYNASYYSVRIVEPGTGFFWVLDLVAAIGWASTEPHKADIISMSVTTYDDSYPTILQQLENACNNAYNAGIILVAGSGNETYTYSGWPAAFNNVISVGGYAKDQTVAYYSNGGVDIVAPGGGDLVTYSNNLYSVGPDNAGYWCWGTSYATPHASALLALQLQYAREHNIEVNNGYLWESMNHSAKQLTGQPYDPIYQGKGKIWAAGTTNPPPPPQKGSVDLMSSSIWPFDYDFEYLNYVYLEDGLYPAYYIGTNMYQNITLTNLTDVEGNAPETIENLNVTTIQKYLDTGEPMPGTSTEDFTSYEPIIIDAGSNLVLQDTYYLPWSTIPGLDKTVLSLEFKFAGNNRLMKITDNEASIWCPPPPINEGFPVE